MYYSFISRLTVEENEEIVKEVYNLLHKLIAKISHVFLFNKLFLTKKNNILYIKKK